MKKIFSTILIAGLLLPAFVLAYDFGYVRTPSGFEITSPVNFWVQYDEDWWNNYPDPEESCGSNEISEWRVIVFVWDNIAEEENSFESEKISSSTNPYTFEMDLPLSENTELLTYLRVEMQCFPLYNYVLEENEEIFRIVESEEPAGVFGFPSDFVDLSLGYVDEFLNDIGGPVALIFGLVLGMFIINYFLILVRERKKRG